MRNSNPLRRRQFRVRAGHGPRTRGHRHQTPYRPQPPRLVAGHLRDGRRIVAGVAVAVEDPERAAVSDGRPGLRHPRIRQRLQRRRERGSREGEEGDERPKRFFKRPEDPRVNGDLKYLRGSYLGKFCHWLHLTPHDVDGLAVTDFIALVQWCDGYEAQLSKAG